MRSLSHRRRTLGAVFVVAGLFSLGGVTDHFASAADSPNARRLCKPRVAWSGIGETRAIASQRAREGWASAVAATYGEAFTTWAIAGIARTSCTLTPEGHKCQAAASPCRDLKAGEGPSGPPAR